MEQIWYRAATEYFSITETFNEAYDDLIQATVDLYGPFEVEQMTKALQAVEVHRQRGVDFSDFNSDGVTDAADYTVWRDSFGSTDDFRADGNQSGTTDGADFLLWQRNYGLVSSISSTSSTVPEPSTLFMLLAFFAASASTRQRLG